MKHTIAADRAKNKISDYKTPDMSHQKGKTNGLASLKAGERITGSVTAVGTNITLMIKGQEISAPSELFQKTAVGEVISLEVLKITKSIVELKLLNKSLDSIKEQTTLIRMDRDSGTYLSHMEQKQNRAEAEKDYSETKSILENIASSITNKDYEAIEKENISVTNQSFDSLYQAVLRVKSIFSEADATTDSVLAGCSVQGNKSLEEILSSNNIPATEDNVKKVETALTLGAILPNINKNTIAYLIANEWYPTIENIYKAYYNGNSIADETKVSGDVIKEMEKDVRTIIEAAGYELNMDNLSQAEWLLQKGLPLTKESFSNVVELERVSSISDQDYILGNIIKAMKKGIQPKDASVFSEQTKHYEKFVQEIHSIEEQVVQEAIKSNTNISLKKLISLQGNRSQDKEKEQETVRETVEKKPSVDNQAELITAKRQLEEIRLKMTVEAAAKLNNQGFSIETESLARVVEELREIEDRYYRSLLREAQVEPSEASLHILKDTIESMDRLKAAPSFILGSTLVAIKEQTVQSLLKEGNRLTAELTRANEAYETLMTVPNREYGDSIQKAFKNMDSLLEELKMENTIYNQRAVRILGYNRMDITEEAIEKVKTYDHQVNTLIQNLHPAIAVRLIKEGINPLSMPIEELNTCIDRLKEDQGITDTEKFSTYLRRLDKEKGLSSEERKAYIGIYRLLHAVEKTDGAAVGALIKADREITLNNLLTSVRTYRRGGLEAMIDDEFGTLQEISYEKETISLQLKGIFQEDIIDNRDKDYINYLNSTIKQIKEELTPTALDELKQAITREEANTSIMNEKGPGSTGVWEAIKDASVEVLYDKLHYKSQESLYREELYAEKVKELREVYKNSDQALRFLNDFKIPGTTTNLLMASQLLSNNGSVYKRLLQLKEDKSKETSKKGLKEFDNLTDTLIDKITMNEAIEEVDREVTELTEQEIIRQQTDAEKVNQLKQLGDQIRFLKTLAKREFYQIPIQTEGGVTNMNLTIVRNARKEGKVLVTIHTERLGNIKAELKLKDKSLKGFLICDHRNGLDTLKKHTEIILKTAKEEDVLIQQLDFGMLRRDNEVYSYSNGAEYSETELSEDTERLLYRFARAIVTMVKAADSEEAADTKVVSGL